MKMLVCSVFDGAVKAYLQPFFARAKGEALRSFTEAVNNKEHQFFKHAADYTLFVLGEFDDASGSLLSLATPEKLVSANEVMLDDEVFPPSRRLPM